MIFANMAIFIHLYILRKQSQFKFNNKHIKINTHLHINYSIFYYLRVNDFHISLQYLYDIYVLENVALLNYLQHFVTALL